MPLFEADEQTEAIVIYTEPGGRMEAELVDWREANDSRLPIVAFMAGKFMDDEEMQGMSFGHAGTIVEGKEDSATEKIARLEAAGIPVVERIHEIPDVVKEKLRCGVSEQRRHLHRGRGLRRGRDRPRARQEARGGLPGRHLQGRRLRRRDRAREPRRVRALRALPRRRAARHRRGQEALRRHRAAALIRLAAVDPPSAGRSTAAATRAPPKPDRRPKPPKPKPPEVDPADRHRAGVAAQRRDQGRGRGEARRQDARVEAGSSSTAFPRTSSSTSARSARKLATTTRQVRFELSPRQKEVLDFAIKSCRGAKRRDRRPSATGSAG